MSTTQDRPAPMELKWIDEPADKLIRPPPEEFGPINDRTFTSLFLKKSKENIFVPVGLIATATCLTLGLVNLKKGDSKKQQIFMRGRVGFQGFTLAAMVIGAWLTSQARSAKD